MVQYTLASRPYITSVAAHLPINKRINERNDLLANESL